MEYAGQFNSGTGSLFKQGIKPESSVRKTTWANKGKG